MDENKAYQIVSAFARNMSAFDFGGSLDPDTKLYEFKAGRITCSEVLGWMDRCITYINRGRGITGPYKDLAEQFAEAAELNYGNVITHPEALPVTESSLPRDTGNDALFNIKLDNTDVVEVNSSDLDDVQNDYKLRSIINSYGYSHRDLSDTSAAVIAFLADEGDMSPSEIFDQDFGCALDMEPFLDNETDMNEMIETSNVFLETIEAGEQIVEIY